MSQVTPPSISLPEVTTDSSDVHSSRPLNDSVAFRKAEIEQSVSSRFEEQVRRYPGRLAAKTERHELTYDALNQNANGVARAILARRGEGGEPIALLLAHDAPLIAAILGVLKSGKFYVPLDPSFPEARNSSILEDSQAGLVLTDDQNLAMAETLAGRKTSVLNVTEIGSAFPADNPGLAIDPGAIAYLIYTSGSTGRPKGVLQLHRNLLHNMMKYTNTAHLRAEDRFSLLASCSVSASRPDIFGALLNGGSVFPFRVREEGLASLADWLVQQEITVYHSVPTLFRHLLESVAEQTIFPRVRLVKLGGELVYGKDVELYRKHFSSSCLLYAGLGGSEMGNVRVFLLDKQTEFTGSAVPAGFAMEDTEVLLLDENGQEVGPGCIGEIAIRSAYLSPGYWRRPDLTEAAFAPDPAAGSLRIYRSGDLGRLRPDGCLEHLGRKDFQVKVRGHRVELAEIEMALLDLPTVKETVVLAREDAKGEKDLVAFVVPRAEAVPPTPELRLSLQKKLPDYMVPSDYVFLEALPLTPNGKVDRRALSNFDRAPRDRPGLFTPPRTPVEHELAGIWAHVFGLERVGIHDNFLEMGGHSLTAMGIISRIGEVFGVELAPRSLWEAPSVAQMAALIVERLAEDVGREELTRLLARIEALPEPEAQRLLSRIDLLSQAKRTLLELQLLEKRPDSSRASGIPRRTNSGPAPLSFAQQRLWFLHQLDPHSPVYNSGRAFRMTGNLNVEALQRALSGIVARHESLRTTFPILEESPMQVVSEGRRAELPLIDLAGLAPQEREAELQRYLKRETIRPFNLAHDSPLRASLLRLEKEQHVLHLVTHHIAFDVWSTRVLFRELALFYQAFATGSAASLTDLPIQYADFSAWQRSWLQGEILKNQLSYWRRQLSGDLPVLNLPTDRPRPKIQSFAGSRRSLRLPLPLSAGLQTLSRREGVTLFMTLFAAFQTLLHRYSGQEEILIGTPVANRSRVETEGLIGFFANTLALRVDLSGNPTFRRLLTRVREAVLGALEHQELPFEKLVEELQPKRSLNHTPVFQVLFDLKSSPVTPPELPGLSATPIPIDTGTAKFDLVLSLTEEREGLIASLEYNSDLFDSWTAARMLGHYQRLLEGILADPDLRLSELPLLRESERRQILLEWNDTGADYPGALCIHELFEAQAERTPEALAVISENERLTYHELNERATELAKHLRAIGVGPEVVVGLCLERSVGMVVGLLGILKSGGAYLPLDPGYPKERLAHMLEETQAPVLVSRKQLLKGIPDNGRTVVCLGLGGRVTGRRWENNGASGVTPKNLAFVAYTSGSTGRPKGVLVTHRSLVNHTVAISKRFGLEPSDRVLQFASLSFDVAAEELFPSWSSGAAVVLSPAGISGVVSSFVRFLKRQGVTVVNLPSSFWHEWALELSGSEVPLPPALRLVVVGSERVLTERLALWRQFVGDRVRWCNAYGATEATITTTLYELGGSELADKLPSVPIGRPIANTRIYVLDRERHPVPVGVAGELYIGGAGVARGYLKQPELTAEKFIPDPFGEDPAAHLYRTGDLARYLPDGNIELLGRLDGQVKVRGHRIELGEVESALRRFPEVLDCAVIAREEAGEKSLVAYLVSGRNRGPRVKDLRRHLSRTLPEYAMPSVFVKVEALPLSGNWKLDRSRLPEANRQRTNEKRFIAPRNDIEARLAGIWERVLAVAPIGITDDYFELGGHSLLAVRLLAQVQKAFGRELPLATILEAPTIAKLARILRQKDWVPSWSPLVALQPKGSKPPFYCVHAIGGNVLTYIDLARHLGPDQPVYGLQAKGLDGREIPHIRIEDMAADYVTEIRKFQPEGPYFLGGASAGGIVAFEIAQQLKARGLEVGLLALFDTRGPRQHKRLSDSVRLRALRLVKRLDLHLGNFRAAEGRKEKLAYLATKSRRLRERVAWFRKRRLETLREISLAADRDPLPRTLRRIENATWRASDQYVPQVYPGRVTLFRATKQPPGFSGDLGLGWTRVAGGGLEVYEVPGYHGAIVYEPRIKLLAKELKCCLERAQAPNPGNQVLVQNHAGAGWEGSPP